MGQTEESIGQCSMTRCNYTYSNYCDYTSTISKLSNLINKTNIFKDGSFGWCISTIFCTDKLSLGKK
jgi:hypothetical protein